MLQAGEGDGRRGELQAADHIWTAPPLDRGAMTLVSGGGVRSAAATLLPHPLPNVWRAWRRCHASGATRERRRRCRPGLWQPRRRHARAPFCS